MAKRWTDTQRRALLDCVGGFGWQVLRRRTGARTKAAITRVIARHYGGGGITRGTYSLREVMAETGYSSSQLERAAQALGQRWPRTARGGDYLIQPDQVEDMVGWLKTDYWSPKLRLYSCVRCGTEKNPHKAKGLCIYCYRRKKKSA